jgi:hypothetical protein
MGEARRRKRAAGADAPVQSFRVPRGKLAITIKVGDENPCTVMFDADIVADVVRTIDQTAGRPPYDEVVHGLADQFVRCKRAGTDFRSVGAGAIWTALYHPELGTAMREAVSRELRDKGKAHIVWRLSEKGFAFALVDKFVDLDAALAEAPRDTPVVVGRIRRDDDSKPN